MAFIGCSVQTSLYVRLVVLKGPYFHAVMECYGTENLKGGEVDKDETSINSIVRFYQPPSSPDEDNVIIIDDSGEEQEEDRMEHGNESPMIDGTEDGVIRFNLPTSSPDPDVTLSGVSSAIGRLVTNQPDVQSPPDGRVIRCPECNKPFLGDNDIQRRWNHRRVAPNHLAARARIFFEDENLMRDVFRSAACLLFQPFPLQSCIGGLTSVYPTVPVSLFSAFFDGVGSVFQSRAIPLPYVNPSPVPLHCRAVFTSTANGASTATGASAPTSNFTMTGALVASQDHSATPPGVAIVSMGAIDFDTVPFDDDEDDLSSPVVSSDVFLSDDTSLSSFSPSHDNMINDWLDNMEPTDDAWDANSVDESFNFHF